MRWIAAIAALFVLTIATPARAEKRVVLLAIEGSGGVIVKDAVDEVLQSQATVMSSAAFQRVRQASRIGELSEGGYATIALAMNVDAFVSGTWRKGRKGWILRLYVRDGTTGEIQSELMLTRRSPRMNAAAKEAIAAKLLRSIRNVGGPDTPDPAVPVKTGTGTTTDGTGTTDGSSDGTTDGTSDGTTDGTTDGTSDGTTDGTTDGTSDGTTTEDGTTDGTTTDGTSAEITPAPEDSTSSEAPIDEEPREESGGLGPISGKTFGYARAPMDGKPLQQVSASLFLSARPKFTDGTSARIEFQLDSFETSPMVAERSLRFGLREAFVSLKQDGWLLRIGQQIIPWGSSDGINPIDFLTARDYRVFNSDDELSRIGAWSGMVSRATTNTEATLVVTPIHPVTTLLIPSSLIPPGVTIAPPTRPVADLKNTEVAGKLKYAGSGWDVSLVGFWGFNHTPEVELVTVDETGVTIRKINRRNGAVGVDGSIVVGKVVMRYETAYVRTSNSDGDDPTRLPPHVFGVVGVERPFGDRVRAQIQAIARYYPKWTSPAKAMGDTPELMQARVGVATANALLLDYQDRFRPAATALIAYGADGERFEAELFGLMNFIGRDFLVRPMFGWNPSDAMKLQVGVEGFYGSRARPLGSLYRFGGAFAQATFSF